MGADLYIKGHDQYYARIQPDFDAACAERDQYEPSTPEFEKAQEKVSALYDAMFSPEWYFRDSYNASSLFWRLGLSWWQDLQRFELPEEEQTGEVSVDAEGCRKLLAEVESRELQLWTEAERVAEGWAEPLDEVNAYFVGKRDRFVRFLKTAEAAGGFYASV